MTRVALIGVGRIGLPVGAGLARAGHEVTAFDVRPDQQRAALDAGLRCAPDLERAVVDAEVLVTVLPGSPELRTLMLGDGSPGLIDRLSESTTWIDLTSASPAVGRELAAAAQQADVEYLDAPIGGGPLAAREARLTFYVGGDAELLARHRPLLQSVAPADRIFHVGGPGSGYLTKLLVNVLWFSQAVSVTEVLLLAQHAGISTSLMGDVLATGPAASAFVTDYLPRLLGGDYAADFGLDRCVEELQAARTFAAELATPFTVAAEVTRMHEDALAHFGPVAGELLGAAYLEHLAGHTLRSDT
jgi:3-hydroxyisobutyrate dehydrogenase-like beta-hydroxyacid dehydrogenase